MNYHVSKSDVVWVTKRDGDLTVGIHKTQQQAIDAAKKRAAKDYPYGSVSWEDEYGELQGSVDYAVLRDK